MSKDEERQYAEIHRQVLASTFSKAATVAGEAVARGVKYRTACEAIYAAHYQALFGSAMKELQNAKKIPTGLTVEEAWKDRSVHELVVHEIVRKAIVYLSGLDARNVWSVNILKKPAKR